MKLSDILLKIIFYTPSALRLFSVLITKNKIAFHKRAYMFHLLNKILLFKKPHFTFSP